MDQSNVLDLPGRESARNALNELLVEHSENVERSDTSANPGQCGVDIRDTRTDTGLAVQHGNGGVALVMTLENQQLVSRLSASAAPYYLSG